MVDCMQTKTTVQTRQEEREALRREAQAAHDHYMRTGLHLTNDEVIAWMEAIIRGEKPEPLKCHR